MLRVLVSFIVILMFNGCVDIERAGNWRPQTESTVNAYDLCRQSAEFAPGVGRGGIGASHIQCEKLLECMKEQGYQLRKREVILDALRYPITLLEIIGGGCIR